MVKLGVAGGAAYSGVELLCLLDSVQRAAGLAVVGDERAMFGFAEARA